jgi:hypothetical protein
MDPPWLGRKLGSARFTTRDSFTFLALIVRSWPKDAVSVLRKKQNAHESFFVQWFVVYQFLMTVRSIVLSKVLPASCRRTREPRLCPHTRPPRLATPGP